MIQTHFFQGKTLLQMDQAAFSHQDFYGTSRNAVYTQIWIAICDYLLLIIAKKHYGLEPSLHTISNSIGQILFKRGDIREMYNQPSFPVIVPEAAYGRQLTLW